MKWSFWLLFFIVSLLFFSRPGWTLEVIKPAEGQRVEVGSTLRIVVKPQPGEKWKGVAAAFEALSFDKTLGAYVGRFPVPARAQLGPREIMITALSNEDEEVKLKRNIVIVLPSNIKLQKLLVDTDPIIMTKLPPGEDPNMIRVFETEKLGVGGMYSDGVERDTSSAASGTTYQSSDEKVVKIDPNGNITAVSPGTAVITIRNGDQSAKVKVIVKQES